MAITPYNNTPTTLIVHIKHTQQEKEITVTTPFNDQQLAVNGISSKVVTQSHTILIPKSHAENIQLTGKVFVDTIHDSIVKTLGAAKLIDMFIENEEKEVVALCKKLLTEYANVKTEEYAASVSFILYLAQETLSEDEIYAVISDDFKENISKLPSFKEVLDAFPEIKELCENAALSSAKKLEAGIRIIFLAGIKHKMATKFRDPLACAPLNGAVHFIPNDPKDRPVSYSTLIKMERQVSFGRPVISPFSGNEIVTHVHAANLEVAKNNFLCENLYSMLCCLEKGDYESFVTQARGFIEDTKKAPLDYGLTQNVNEEKTAKGEAISTMVELIEVMGKEKAKKERQETVNMLIQIIQHILATFQGEAFKSLMNYVGEIERQPLLREEILSSYQRKYEAGELAMLYSNKPKLNNFGVLFIEYAMTSYPFSIDQNGLQYLAEKNWKAITN